MTDQQGFLFALTMFCGGAFASLYRWHQRLQRQQAELAELQDIQNYNACNLAARESIVAVREQAIGMSVVIMSEGEQPLYEGLDGVWFDSASGRVFDVIGRN